MLTSSFVTILITDLARQAGFETDMLVSRQRGEQLLSALLLVIADNANSTIVLNFVGIKVVTASCIDAIFGALAVQRAARRVPNACVLLENVEQHTEEIMFALSTRPEREPKLRNAVVPVRDSHGEVTLVGKVESHVEQTFALLQRQKQLTARAVATTFELEIGAASTRLKVLYDLGLTHRMEERDSMGKQYVYFWPF